MMNNNEDIVVDFRDFLINHVEEGLIHRDGDVMAHLPELLAAITRLTEEIGDA